MATQNIPIQFKATEVAARVPTATDLIERQIVLNLTDGKIWSKTSAGMVVRLGGPTLAELAVVAATGSYNDLIDKPYIPPDYLLPAAQPDERGGIRIGSGVNLTDGDLLNADVLSVAGEQGTAQTGVVVLTRADFGLDILDANNKIEPQYLPDSITGAMVYKGTWDASANTPTIPAAEAANLGWLYVVAVAGTTTIDGISTWNIGDWIVSDGTKWSRVPVVTGNVVSVNGQTGVVVVNATNLPGLSAVGRTGNYSDLLNKPSTFPPSAHNQSISTITDAATVAATGDYNDLINKPPNPATTLVGFNAVGSPVLQGNVRYPFAETVRFAQDFAGSTAFFTLYTGSTATVQLNRIRSGTPTNVGSIQYAQSTGEVVFTSTEAEPEFLPQDQIEWVWPSNIAQFTTNLLGTRQA